MERRLTTILANFLTNIDTRDNMVNAIFRRGGT